MKFIIDKKLVLNTDENVIYHFEDNEKALYISAIATRLFTEILINPSGVTRVYLLEKVWSEHGLTPSSNNLNNHISMLRKAVFNVTGDRDYITTLPKKGFIFNRKYVIELANPDEIKSKSSVGVAATEKKTYSRVLVMLPYAMTLMLACLFMLSSDKTHYDLIGESVFFKYKRCDLKPLKDISFNKKSEAISMVENAINKNNINCDTDNYDIYFYLKNKSENTTEIIDNYNIFYFCKRESNGDYSYCRNVKSV
ncbi:winged helix-turn-helix domain-containing protein [Serratia sp. L9]|uniref:winged helix-turn-helix domain-containing protein n=1 Tax=Serratia sp. L9 TaxID=3423946 RepID=UPI003D66EE49